MYPEVTITLINTARRDGYQKEGDQHIGLLAREPRVGDVLILDRRTKNGKKAEGIWTTSSIRAVKKVSETEYIFLTRNSSYRLVLSIPDRRIKSGESEWLPS